MGWECDSNISNLISSISRGRKCADATHIILATTGYFAVLILSAAADDNLERVCCGPICGLQWHEILKFEPKFLNISCTIENTSSRFKPWCKRFGLDWKPVWKVWLSCRTGIVVFLRFGLVQKRKLTKIDQTTPRFKCFTTKSVRKLADLWWAVRARREDFHFRRPGKRQRWIKTTFLMIGYIFVRFFAFEVVCFLVQMN